MEALSDDDLQAKTAEFRQRLDNGEDLDDLLIEAFAVVPRGGAAGDRPAPLRRAAHGRRRPALRLDRRDEDRRGQDPRVDPARLPQRPRPARACTSSPSTTTWPRRDAEWMGRIHRWLGLEVGLIVPGDYDTGLQARASTPCDITYGTNNEFGFDYLRDNMATVARAQGPAGPRLRHRRRGRLDPHRRGPHAAHHLAAGSPTPPSSTTSSPAIVRGLQRDVDYEVDEEKRTVAPTETGIEKVEQALGVENLYDGVAQNLVHQLQAALRAKELYKRDKDYIIQQRRGEDRRRVHRPHPRGPALVRGPAPGRRGQGGGEDQGGEPDPRHDHPPELLPHVREARRHDRHGHHRGRRVRQHLRPPGRPDPHQQADGPRRPGRPHLQDRGRQVRGRASTTSSSATRPASRCSSAPISVEKSEKLSPPARQAGHPPRGAQRQAALPRGRDRRPGRPAPRRSPWPPTWPAAASTSSSAATPRASPSATCGPRASSSRPRRARPATRSCSRSTSRVDQGRGRQGPRARRPLRARHRAPREPPHRQPAAGPLRPPGRPGREPLLPVARGRPHAPVRHRRHGVGDGQGPARRRAHRGEDGHQGHRAGAEHRRAAQRRDPQERPQVRRGHERAAQGRSTRCRDQILDGADLRDEALRGPGRRASRRHRSAPTASPTTARSGTSRASLTEVARYWPTEAHRRASWPSAVSTDELYELPHGRGHRLLRAARGRARRRTSCARSSAR